MTNKEMLQKMMNTLEEVNTKITSIDERVTALEKGKKPTNSGKGSSKEEKLFSTDIKDYEPKKDKEGNFIWRSYKAKATDYCYAVATKGKALGCYVNGEKVYDFKDIEVAYNKAKADFKAKYKYIKKADR